MARANVNDSWLLQYAVWLESLELEQSGLHPCIVKGTIFLSACFNAFPLVSLSFRKNCEDSLSTCSFGISNPNWWKQLMMKSHWIQVTQKIYVIFTRAEYGPLGLCLSSRVCLWHCAQKKTFFETVSPPLAPSEFHHSVSALNDERIHNDWSQPR